MIFLSLTSFRGNSFPLLYILTPRFSWVNFNKIRFIRLDESPRMQQLLRAEKKKNNIKKLVCVNSSDKLVLRTVWGCNAFTFSYIHSWIHQDKSLQWEHGSTCACGIQVMGSGLKLSETGYSVSFSVSLMCHWRKMFIVDVFVWIQRYTKFFVI